VLNGDADKFTTAEQIAAFKKEMEAAQIDYRFISYPGAMHSFTNPDADKLAKQFNMPIGYNAEADRKSWEEMKQFLTEIFEMKVNTRTLYTPSTPSAPNTPDSGSRGY
jgi:dienelactone hydrolase